MGNEITNRKNILKMLKDGIITSEEALEILKNNVQINAGIGIALYGTEWTKLDGHANEEISEVHENIIIFDLNESLYDCINSSDWFKGKVFLVTPGEEFKAEDQNKYKLNPKDDDSYIKLLNELEKVECDVNKIVYFWAKDYKKMDKSAESRLDESVYSIFNMSKAIMKNRKKNAGYVDIVYAYEFDNNLNPFYGAIDGYFKTLQLENPAFRCKTVTIDLNSISDKDVNEIIIKEVNQLNKDEMQVYYDSKQRYVKHMQRINEEENTDLAIKKNGVYIIAGGLGNIGYQLALDFVSKAPVNLILLGTSQLNEEKLIKLRNLGSQAEYISVDISSKEEVYDLVNKSLEKYGHINGFIHSAGAYDNAFLLKKDVNKFKKVISSKVYGTVNMDEALKDEDLDFFILFSSTSGVFGKVGQGDYSYANSFLDNFALSRNEKVKNGIKKGRTASINWPYWELGGMAEEITTDERQAYVNEAGIQGLKPVDAMNFFYEDCLKGSKGQYVVFYGEKDRIYEYFDEYIIKNIKEENLKNNIEIEVNENYKVDNSELLKEKTEEFLKQMISDEIGIDTSNINLEASFEDLGIDSIIINHFNAELEKRIKQVPKTILYEYSNIAELTGYFIKNHKKDLESMFNLDVKKVEKPKVEIKPVDKKTVNIKKNEKVKEVTKFIKEEILEDDIAIIGVSGRYPMSNNIDEFWNNLVSAKDCVTEVPKTRWDHSKYYDANSAEVENSGKTYCKYGGFLENIDKFDPLFFNMSPREAEHIDPQERLFLEVVWETIEDAGYTRESLRKNTNGDKTSNVGVFVGTTTYQYDFLGLEEWSKGNYITPITHPWSIANRISYIFNFDGPSIPIDTACSSSLSAVHFACESLKRGDCKVAVAGGIHLYLHPYKYISMAQMGMFSRTGRCKAFSDDADGFVPGEGVGALLLKPLKDAIKDGDYIYSVIKATAVNHGGKVNGYTVPNPNAQAKVIENAIEKAGINPRTMGYIEAHGTGTKLGDPIEISGLTKAFRKYTKDNQYCSIGSVKSNIGHLESAAGIAAITKVLLQFKHKKFVPSLHCEKTNQNINIEESPFKIQRTYEDWIPYSDTKNGETKVYARIAGVSAFGAGGANAHVILEEYNNNDIKENRNDESQVIVLSAKNEERMREYVQKFVTMLEEKAKALEIPSCVDVISEKTKERIENMEDINDDTIINYTKDLKELENFEAILLADSFRRMGAFLSSNESYDKYELRSKLGIIPLYNRLYDALIDILIRHNFIEIDNDNLVVTELINDANIVKVFNDTEKAKNDFNETHKRIESYTKLMKTCIDSYPIVLTGQKDSVDVMFPQGKVDLVEGIYKGNKIIDYYNKLVAITVRKYVEQRLNQDPKAYISILEIGSGTGGTSIFALKELQKYAKNIKYYYTDISNGLVQYGKKEFKEYTFAEFKVLNVEEDANKQGFNSNSIDLVFATNVLHATKDIKNTLLNIKEVLQKNGVLIINEFTSLGDFSTLTYGLTKGWWLFKDEEVRIKRAPLLSIDGWKKCLKECSFDENIRVLSLPDKYKEECVQNVMVCEFNDSNSEESKNAIIKDFNLRDAAYTSQFGREEMEERLALIVKTPEELLSKLKLFLNGQFGVNGVYSGNIKDNNSKSNFLLKGKAGKQFLSALLKDKQYDYAAQLWIQGIEIDWSLLYDDNEELKHIPLPVYPFAKNRCWINQVEADDKINYTISNKLNTLVDTNLSTLSKCKYKKEFSGKEYYIKDHKNVLPGVVYLEMVRQIASIANDNIEVKKIKNFVWSNPIDFQNGPKSVYVEFYLCNNEGVQFEVYTKGNDENKVINATGILPEEQFVEKVSEVYDIETIISRCDNAIEKSKQYYNRMEEVGNAPDKRFRGITEFYCNEKEAIAKVGIIPEYESDIKDYILHPTLIDGAFQILNAFAWFTFKEGEPIYVPFALDEINIIKDSFVPAYSYLKLNDNFNKDNEESITSDLMILDDNGEVVVIFKNLTFRQIPKKYLNLLDEKEKVNEINYYERFLERKEISSVDDNYGLDNLIIFDNGNELKKKLSYINEKTEIVNVNLGENFKKIDTFNYEINATNAEDYKLLFDQLNEDNIAVKNIVHAWSDDKFAYDIEVLNNQLSTSIYSVFNTCKELNEYNSEKVNIYYIYRYSKTVTPQYAAISGFTNSLKLENAKINVKILAFDIELEKWNEYKIDKVPQILIKELSSNNNDTDIDYSKEERRVRYIRKMNFKSKKENKIKLKKDGVYVITGGMGGIGKIFTQYLQEKYDANVILCGRSKLDDKIKSQLEMYASNNSKIKYIQCNISDEKDVERLANSITLEFGSLDGVIHAAGVVKDNLIARKNSDDMKKVLEPKIYGAIYLNKILRKFKPDFIAMFSSTAAIFGNAGQTDYSYANAFMDYYADLIKEEGMFRTALSINWGLWNNGGMRPDEQNEKLLSDIVGIKAMESEDGIEAFEKGIFADITNFAVVAGDHSKIKKIPVFYEEVKPNAVRLEERSSKSVVTKTSNVKPSNPKSSSAKSINVVNEFKNDVFKMISELLRVEIKDISEDEELNNYGFDSITYTRLSKMLNDKFQLDISPAHFFGYSTVKVMIDRIYSDNTQVIDSFYNLNSNEEDKNEEKPAINEITDNSTVKKRKMRLEKIIPPKSLQPETIIKREESVYDPIVIVGMGGTMPQSNDINEFWSNIEQNKSLITEIPKDRWDWKEIYGDPNEEEGKADVKWGGFMKDIYNFDATFFSMPPVDAELMDPQERLMLQTAWATIEDAGYKVSDFSGTNTGVFVGISNTDYKLLLNKKGITEIMPSQSFVANRISYTLDLHGPSETVDSACSSAILAIHRAVAAIERKECESAIVGAVNVIASPDLYILDCKLGILSKDGKCKAFDEKADGYVRGEGVGAILIKPLSKALEDKDHIYAVIKGSAVSYGGRGGAINAPNSDAQAEVVVKAINNAGINPNLIKYVDAHGTGTLLGDAAEIDGLKKAFEKSMKKYKTDKHYYTGIGIGSVKTNIGHLEAMAGMAGVFKVVMAMKNGVIPASLHFEKLNPYVNLKNSPFYIVGKNTVWPTSYDENNNIIPKYGAVSSFGAGGTNAHIIFEEYVENKGLEYVTEEPQVFILSSRDKSRLKDYVSKMINYLDNNDTSVHGKEDKYNYLNLLEKEVKKSLASILLIEESEIDRESSFEEYGVDFMVFSKLLEVISQKLKVTISDIQFSESSSVKFISEHIIEKYEQNVKEYLRIEITDIESKKLNLAQIAYTLQIGRDSMNERLAAIASTVEELKMILIKYINEEKNIENLYEGNANDKEQLGLGLFDEDECKNIIKSLIDDAKLNRIAYLWSKGIDIDWTLINRESTLKRISLPTYPFAEDKYLVKDHTDNEEMLLQEGEIAVGIGDDKLDDEELMNMLRKVEKEKYISEDILKKI